MRRVGLARGSEMRGRDGAEFHSLECDERVGLSQQCVERHHLREQHAVALRLTPARLLNLVLHVLQIALVVGAHALELQDHVRQRHALLLDGGVLGETGLQLRGQRGLSVTRTAGTHAVHVLVVHRQRDHHAAVEHLALAHRGDRQELRLAALCFTPHL